MFSVDVLYREHEAFQAAKEIGNIRRQAIHCFYCLALPSSTRIIFRLAIVMLVTRNLMHALPSQIPRNFHQTRLYTRITLAKQSQFQVDSESKVVLCQPAVTQSAILHASLPESLGL